MALRAEEMVAELAAETDRQSHIIKRMKEKSNKGADAMMGTVATLAGGAAAGYLDKEYPDKEILSVGAPLAVGGVAVLAGLMGWAGKNSDLVAKWGEGILAYEAGKAIRDSKKKSGTSKAGGTAPAGQVSDAQVRHLRGG